MIGFLPGVYEFFHDWFEREIFQLGTPLKREHNLVIIWVQFSVFSAWTKSDRINVATSTTFALWASSLRVIRSIMLAQRTVRRVVQKFMSLIEQVQWFLDNSQKTKSVFFTDAWNSSCHIVASYENSECYQMFTCEAKSVIDEISVVQFNRRFFVSQWEVAVYFGSTIEKSIAVICDYAVNNAWNI